MITQEDAYRILNENDTGRKYTIAEVKTVLKFLEPISKAIVNQIIDTEIIKSEIYEQFKPTS